MESPSAQPGFARRLTLFDATMIVVSGIIGGGIFINPSVVARAVHTPRLILLVWVIGGIIALAGAFVFAELAAILPRAGGQYAYYREAVHPLAAFLYGWALLFIIQSGSTAAIAVAFAEYVARMIALPERAIVPLAVAVTLAVVLFHSLGIKPGSILINAITFGKTVILIAMIVLAFILTPAETGLEPPPVEHGLTGFALVSTVLLGLVPVMFAYTGWQNVNYLAEEVRAPEKNLPRAILGGVSLVLVVYVSANVAYLHGLSASGLAATRTPAADLAGRLLGPVGSTAVSALIVVSTFGFLNLAVMSAPRVYYAMAQDRVFFRAVGTISPRFRVPTTAIVLQGVLAAVLVLTHSYEKLLGYSVFADWNFFALAGLSLVLLRRKMPGARRPWRMPLYPLPPLLFMLAGVGLVVNTFITDPQNAIAGTAIISLGVPAFFIWRRVTRSRDSEITRRS